jgi:hypothetical protein
MIRSVLVVLVLVNVSLVAAGCTAAEMILRPGETEYLVACGAGLGWKVCYGLAEEMCPTGYRTLCEEGGFNRAELRISCPIGPGEGRYPRPGQG